MKGKLLTINYHFKFGQISHLLINLRNFVQKIKEVYPILEDYELQDVGFIPRLNFVLVKLYFYQP